MTIWYDVVPLELLHLQLFADALIHEVFDKKNHWKSLQLNTWKQQKKTKNRVLTKIEFFLIYFDIYRLRKRKYILPK